MSEIETLKRELSKHKEDLHLFKLTVRSISNCYSHNMVEEQCAKCPVKHTWVALRKRKEAKQSGFKQDPLDDKMDALVYGLPLLDQMSPPPVYEDGRPCKHPGCLSHISHPCEVCGRIGGLNIGIQPRIHAKNEPSL